MSWDYIVTVPEFTGDKEAKIFRKPKTNADRIRSMSDEELAEFIENPNGKPWYRCGECKWESCKECCFEWLKQECAE